MCETRIRTDFVASFYIMAQLNEKDFISDPEKRIESVNLIVTENKRAFLYIAH
jgi:hypothetical protein